MHIPKSAIAAAQLVLLFPAGLFMLALLARDLSPLLYEPAYTAQVIVAWYAGRIWTLWVLLIFLPLAALVIGCGTLLQHWVAAAKAHQTTPQPSGTLHIQPATLMVAALTFSAGIILGVVALHMLMN